MSRRDGYEPLSALVLRAWERLPRIPAARSLREAAADLAWRTWDDRVRAADVLLNVAGLAVAAGDVLHLYAVRPSALRRIEAATRTLAWPTEPPSLLAEPWVVEPVGWRAGDTLTGRTWALGGYTLEGTSYLVGLEGDGARAEAWDPATGAPREGSPVLDGAAQVAWAAAAGRWATALGVLLDAGELRAEDRRELREGERTVLRTMVG